MRWSQAHVPTLRDDPADAEATSHKLLVRAGFVRQLMAGVYSILPLGERVLCKIEQVIREEMDEIGGQAFSLPSLQPRDLWDKSGRWDVMGLEMFKFNDRRGADVGLAMTHEEVFAHLAVELRSYKQLPQIWYQFQKKFRDEARPKSGLLRVREFTMKDSYSLDVDSDGLDRAFDRHFDAYRKIFKRIGFDAVAVEASSGAMGGSTSVEFMLKSDAGEDWIVACKACGHAANTEKASSRIEAISDDPAPAAPERFPTPGIRTIDELAQAHSFAAAERQIKTLVYRIDDKLVLLLLRGCDTLVEQKVIDQIEGKEIRPAEPDEIKAALGASPGSLGAVGVSDLFVVADEALRGRTNMVTGANQDDVHLSGVDIERDIDVKGWLDLREVENGEGCPMCGEALAVQKTIEVGHIFKLGTKYTEAMNATVLNQNGKAVPIVMGSYGIGVERNMAAVVESNHDDAGICWPMNIAPHEVVITVVKPKDIACLEAGERLYDALKKAGVDVMLDDRDERPGVKFKDADLVGFPYRVTVGPKGLEAGVVELRRRANGETRDLPLEHASDEIVEAVADERS